MTEENTSQTLERGVAKIKEEFIVLNHSRELNVNFISNKDKKCIDQDGGDAESGGPPRKKLKGQNKHRPHRKRTPKAERLCFLFGLTGSCQYGDKCVYSHDIKSYLSAKPEDIGETCYLFKTFGKCPYSLSCRFGSKHIDDGKNIINDELYKNFKDKALTANSLSKELQTALRRRTYDFCKSHEVIKKITDEFKFESSSNSDAKSQSTESEDISGCKPEEKDGLSAGSDACSLTETATESNFCEKVKPSECLSATDEPSDSNNGKIESSAETERSSSVSMDCDTSRRQSTDSELVVDKVEVRLPPRERKRVDFRDKLYLAPLTTVGNLPFRRICKEFGADITCGEMAMASSLLQGSQSEWALLKRHHTEDIFGIQVCGGHVDVMTKCCQLLNENIDVDFIDLNLGCPLDMVCKKGAGCGLMNRTKRLDDIICGMTSAMDVPLTLKMRTGLYACDPIALNVIKRTLKWKDHIGLITVHGRSRVQRYTKSADWDYIDKCSKLASPIPLFGSGDVLSYEDYNLHRKETSVAGIMIARGALIKPWIFKEIKEQTHWDISSRERFDILQSYVNYGLEHWGSDSEGVEKTRRFLLEWLSFLYRYIPVGLLEQLPQRINERPPPYRGRDDLETLMASPSCADWIKISEMLLGPVPDNFTFLPKHKANAYQ